MSRPSLKARDIEALAYIYNPQARSPVPELHWQRGVLRGASAMVLVAPRRLLLTALLMCRRATARLFERSLT